MQIIILAAGKGDRMKSKLPKMIHQVNNKPMLGHVIDNCLQASDDIVLVYSEKIKDFILNYQNKCKLVKQEKQLGTAHAVFTAKHIFAVNKSIVIMYGDTPLVKDNTIHNMINHMHDSKSQVTVLAFEHKVPNNYGKIVLDCNGNFYKIVESSFANLEEQEITLCNSGIMVFAPSILEKYIGDCCKNIDCIGPHNELLLTDIIEICNNNGEKVSYYRPNNNNIALGVNTQEDLTNINSLIK